MTDPRSVDEAAWARLYLLLTAIEGAVEDAERGPESALQQLHEEYAILVGCAESAPGLAAAELLRRELRYARRLLDALYVGRQLDDRLLTRTERPCATLGCGNDALVRYCLSCEAHRARISR